MAKIKYLFASAISGKQGGTIYSSGIGGAYIKNWAAPTNPQSTRQIAVRAQLSTLASSWRGLSEAERDAWDAKKGEYPAINSFGDSYTPSGYQLYMTLNSNLNAVGASTIDAVVSPVAFVPTEFSSFTVELTAGVVTTGNFVVTEDTGANESTLIEMTPPLSPGVSKPSSGKFKKVLIGAAVETSFDFAAAYVALYGQPAVGQKIFLRSYRINTTTGQRQLLAKVSTIVTTV